MSALRPKLRQTITGHPDSQDGEFVWLYDSFRLTTQSLRLHRGALELLQLFDGRSSLTDIQAGWLKSGLGLLPSSVLDKLVSTLDEALFLESERYQQHLQQYLMNPVRPPACIGCYDGEPERLRVQLDQLFTTTGGPGIPVLAGTPAGSMRGAMIPHIDYARGNVTYGWGFKEVVDKSDADVFVILGTSHFSTHRYVLTRKDFATPLGVVKTDRDYVDRIANSYGNAGFEDELAHLPEHSIELHAVLLQHLMQQRGREFTVVPVLVGSFQDTIAEGRKPETFADIDRMVKALREAEAESRQKVCYLISGDLAHIGPKFGDGKPLHESQLRDSERRDRVLLDYLARGDRSGLYAVQHQEGDARRICGFPPVYTFLSVVGTTPGKILHYQQYVEPRGSESVSFASVAFYR